jgi:t-SNARE complex subunit (syntaxin)
MIRKMIPQSEKPFYHARENRNACIVLVIIIFIGIMFLVL